MYTNGCNGGCQFVSSEIFFFLPLEIRWDSTRGRTGSRIYPSRGMIYHRDVPLKSFLPETVPCKTGLPLPPPLTPCRCNLVFSANVSALVPRSKWIPNELWTLGWWKDRFQIWTSLLSRDVCQCWNFYSYEFLFCLVFFWFSIFFFFTNSGPNLMIPLLLHDTSLAQIFIVFAYRGCYFFFFFGNFV